MHKRRLLTTAVVLVGGIALTGCEKPPPAITAFSGTDSVRSEALCWSFESPSLEPGECAEGILQGTDFEGAPELEVRAGNVVGISVDTVIADEGWIPAIGGQRLVNEPIEETYVRFTFPSAQLPPQGVGLQVLAGADLQVRGVWSVRLVA